MVDANIPINNNSIEHCNFTRESELNVARKLLYSPNHPDGILAFSDQIAINTMLAAKERGIKMPESLSIIGFNNEPVGELLEPSLTSIDQPGYEMGAEAAQLIFDRINNPKLAYTKKVLSSHLIIRSSTNKNKTN